MTTDRATTLINNNKDTEMVGSFYLLGSTMNNKGIVDSFQTINTLQLGLHRIAVKASEKIVRCHDLFISMKTRIVQAMVLL